MKLVTSTTSRDRPQQIRPYNKNAQSLALKCFIEATTADYSTAQPFFCGAAP